MRLVTTAVAPTRWALSIKVSCLIELQIFDHYDALCGCKAGIDDRDGAQNEHLAVDLKVGRWLAVGRSGVCMSMLYVTEMFIAFLTCFTDSSEHFN